MKVWKNVNHTHFFEHCVCWGSKEEQVRFWNQSYGNAKRTYSLYDLPCVLLELNLTSGNLTAYSDILHWRYLQKATACKQSTALDIKNASATEADSDQQQVNSFGEQWSSLQHGLKTHRSVLGTNTGEQFRSCCLCWPNVSRCVFLLETWSWQVVVCRFWQAASSYKHSDFWNDLSDHPPVSALCISTIILL